MMEQSWGRRWPVGILLSMELNQDRQIDSAAVPAVPPARSIQGRCADSVPSRGIVFFFKITFNLGTGTVKSSTG